MEAAGVDVLVLGREANARYVSGAPRLWTRRVARRSGPGCVLVRATGAVHLLSTWDEGIPDDIPHEHLYGISFNPMNFVAVLQGIEGAGDRPDGRHRRHDRRRRPACCRWRSRPRSSSTASPLLRRCRQVKTPEEVEAIRASVRGRRAGPGRRRGRARRRA